VQEDPTHVKSQMLMQTMKIDPETTINHCQKLHEETDEIAKLNAKTSSQVNSLFLE
jgi:glucose-6-phosphate isomerase